MNTLLRWFTIIELISSILCDHWSNRDRLIQKESSMAVGANLELNEMESCASDTLLRLKLNELDRGLDNPNNFYAGTSFLKTAKYIDSSEVFNFIKKIPKGAALHLHDMALAPTSYLYQLTFSENLYVCWTKNNRLLLNFFQFHIDNRCEWVPLEIAREEEGFEDLLLSQLSLSTSIYRASTSNQVAWNELMGTFSTIEGLVSYKPIFTAYLSEVLTEMYEDNVMYVELRTMLLPVYDLEGNEYGPSEVARLLRDVIEDFKCFHSDFLGGKIIYSPSRMVDQSWIDHYMEIIDELTSLHPDFVAGFDLMGQEDASYPLSKFVTNFEGMKSKVNFFFSVGETNWIGSNGDLNLYDAVLLRPKRIGHAFSLFTHPEILNLIRKHDIAIELCPISNQMMMLVGDLRNHPGKYLISRGYPIVVSSDNPGFWGAKTLSHDWYMVFIAMSDRMTSLNLLKQLAINSIKYSTISNKRKAYAIWGNKWEKFINESCKNDEFTGYSTEEEYTTFSKFTDAISSEYTDTEEANGTDSVGTDNKSLTEETSEGEIDTENSSIDVQVTYTAENQSESIPKGTDENLEENNKTTAESDENTVGSEKNTEGNSTNTEGSGTMEGNGNTEGSIKTEESENLMNETATIEAGIDGNNTLSTADNGNGTDTTIANSIESGGNTTDVYTNTVEGNATDIESTAGITGESSVTTDNGLTNVSGNTDVNTSPSETS